MNHCIFKQLEMVFIQRFKSFGQVSLFFISTEIQWIVLGPKVVSRRITLSHLKEVNQLLKRRVTIWENLNANDYDQRRLCLGPFSGRSTNVCSHLNGMLVNPNCEFEWNFIPLNTLGQWFQFFPEQSDGNLCSSSNVYQVDRAFHRAIEEWLPLFNQVLYWCLFSCFQRINLL